MDPKSRRFLVTGGAGFIGTALLESMESNFSDWFIFDNLLEQVHGKSPKIPTGNNINFVKGDIRDFDLLEKVISDATPDVVIHLAAETGTGQSADQPELHTDVNVSGTAKLIHAMNNSPKKPKTIVLTSSRAVYGEGPWVDQVGNIFYPLGRSEENLKKKIWNYPNGAPLPAKADTSLPRPCNIYGATKLAQEHLLSAWCAANSVNLVILRLQNVYGPGQSPINPYTGVTNFFFEVAGKGKAIPIYEDGNIFRDFIFIDDVVQALKTAIKSDKSEIADVGSGNKHTILDLANIVQQIEGSPDPEVTGQFRLGDVRHAACDMSDSIWVRDGKEPESLESGLKKLHAWLAVQTSFLN